MQVSIGHNPTQAARSTNAPSIGCPIEPKPRSSRSTDTGTNHRTSGRRSAPLRILQHSAERTSRFRDAAARRFMTKLEPFIGVEKKGYLRPGAAVRVLPFQKQFFLRLYLHVDGGNEKTKDENLIFFPKLA